MAEELPRVTEVPFCGDHYKIAYEIAEGVDPYQPGLYLWQIDGVDCYVGKYTRISRPTKHYSRNVQNLRAGKPYRKKNTDGFRRIHRALAIAVEAKKAIRLVILENVLKPRDINAREREVINERRCLLND
jgi:hypothetical protein